MNPSEDFLEGRDGVLGGLPCANTLTFFSPPHPSATDTLPASIKATLVPEFVTYDLMAPVHIPPPPPPQQPKGYKRSNLDLTKIFRGCNESDFLGSESDLPGSSPNRRSPGAEGFS